MLFKDENEFAKSEYLFRILFNKHDKSYKFVFSDGTGIQIFISDINNIFYQIPDLNYISDKVAFGDYYDLTWIQVPSDIRKNVLEFVNNSYSSLHQYYSEVNSFEEAQETNYGNDMSAGEGIFKMNGRYYIKLEDCYLGPYDTYTNAYRITLPDHYSLAGPEFHSPVDLFEGLTD